MKTYKGFVKNAYRREACIAERMLYELAMEYSFEHLGDMKTIGLPTSRHDDPFDGKGTLGRREATMSLDKWHMAHTYVLLNEDEVQPYVDKHMSFLKTRHRKANPKSIAIEHSKSFRTWFKDQVTKELQNASHTIFNRHKSLSYGPDLLASFYSAYVINGCTFYTKDQDDKSTTKNSGVSLEAEAMHFSSAKDNCPIYSKMRYYGVIEEIFELHYMDFTLPVFGCKWVENNNNVVCDSLGHISMNLNRLGHKYDPYILASQAKRVFYMTDPLDKRRSVVIISDPRNAVTDHDDNIRFEERSTPLEVENVDDTSDETSTYVRCDHDEGIWRRGRTILAKIRKSNNTESKIPLEWNHNKIPVGERRESFSNYIGVVVRERVNINYREWEDVPKEVTNEVYAFIMARLRRDWLYESKGKNENVIRRKPPSSLYPWIDQTVWDKFIETYTDSKFKELSDLNRERAKSRTTQYRGGRKRVKELQRQNIPVGDVPRHLVWIRAHSRQENGVTYVDNPTNLEVAQAIKALEAQHIHGEINATGRNDILGRALKTPEHGGSVRGVGSGLTNRQYFGYNKPTHLQTELSKVKSQLTDVLNTQKLMVSYLMSGECNPEQLKQLFLPNGQQVVASSDVDGDRIVGQGLQSVPFQLSHHLVGKQDGCCSANRKSSDHWLTVDDTNMFYDGFQEPNQEKDYRTETYRDKEKGVETETYRVPWPETQKYVPENQQIITQNEQVIIDQSFPKGVESLCSLALQIEKWIHIVAFGTVYVPNEGEVIKHHFKPVPSGSYRVSISEEIDPNALLPCPEGEIIYVCQATGIFLIWPGHLIFPIQKADKQTTKEVNSPCPRSPSSQTSSTQKYTITRADKMKVTTTLIQVFMDVGIGMKKSKKVKQVTIPARVYQHEHCVGLDYEDVLDWCFQREIRASYMSIFMLYLSEIVHKEGISGLYGFCDCNYLSPLTPMERNEDDRCDYLSRVFACNDAKNKNQLFFAPYHERDLFYVYWRHWMLAVICPWVRMVHWLDPTGEENEPRDFAQTIIDKGIIRFSQQHRKVINKIKKKPYIKWKKIECPRQPPSSTDCGYYVCRYMIEIIESRHMIIPDKYFDKAPSTYSQEMIDELREKWISYVSRYHQPLNDDDEYDDGQLEI
ncbi:hypothetical protein RND81_03G039500 [Saponaria officinalis]|uniref:Ubiquitin-like protease family profile domain-containing protein n=1 Tax=Saponaria officinalis TaxID=3572 RepID=A0AAW1M4H4_SAPOF